MTAYPRGAWALLPPNVPIRDGRCDLGGETVCPARERDGQRCSAAAGMFTYAHLCERHYAHVVRGVRVVLVNGTTLDGPAWTRARRLGIYTAPGRAT